MCRDTYPQKISGPTPMAESKLETATSEKSVKAPNILERGKEEIEAITQTTLPHKETHGTSDEIDENTRVDEVKGPSVFERVKEEIEAVVEAILPKKESKNDDHNQSSK